MPQENEQNIVRPEDSLMPAFPTERPTEFEPDIDDERNQKLSDRIEYLNEAISALSRASFRIIGLGVDVYGILQVAEFLMGEAEGKTPTPPPPAVVEMLRDEKDVPAEVNGSDD
jgi:hypothetical protein